MSDLEICRIRIQYKCSLSLNVAPCCLTGKNLNTHRLRFTDVDIAQVSYVSYAWTDARFPHC